MTDVDREEKGKEKQFGNPFLIRKLLILLSSSLPFFPIRMPELTGGRRHGFTYLLVHLGLDKLVDGLVREEELCLLGEEGGEQGRCHRVLEHLLLLDTEIKMSNSLRRQSSSSAQYVRKYGRVTRDK